MTLFECTRLSAKISKVSCKGNKSRGVFACEGCKGLGVETTIDREEVVMATKNKPCLLASDGCKAFAWKQGYCWKHHPDHVANKAAACADKQAIRDIHKAAEIPLPCNDVLVAEEWQVIECEPPPPVTGCEIHIINLLQVFRQQREAQLEQELAELDGDLKALAEPYDKMILVLDRMRS